MPRRSQWLPAYVVVDAGSKRQLTSGDLVGETGVVLNVPRGGLDFDIRPRSAGVTERPETDSPSTLEGISPFAVD